MQLRVVPVALCLTTQHSSSEKTLPPKRHKTLGIEILWMKCPEAHILCQECPNVEAKQPRATRRTSGSRTTVSISSHPPNEDAPPTRSNWLGATRPAIARTDY
jgi:hypothetical protein